MSCANCDNRDASNASNANSIFINNCNDIISSGDVLVGLNPRVRKFGIVNHYDVFKEFPFVSLFPVDCSLALKEMLWIWQSKCGIINELPEELRNKWARLDGTVRKQCVENLCHKREVTGINENNVLDFFGRGSVVDISYSDGVERFIDDILCNETHARLVIDTTTGKSYMSPFDKLLFDLNYDTVPCTRVLKVCDVNDLDFSVPESSVYSVTFSIIDGRLDLVVNQQYQDMASNANWTVVQYALLMLMMSFSFGLNPGILTHVINESFIRKPHILMIKKLMEQESDSNTLKVGITGKASNFYDLNVKSFIVEGQPEV